MASPIPPDIKKAVTFIFLADGQGNLLRDSRTNAPMANGTGFFVAVKGEGDPSRLYGYLVTAKHVLRNAHGAFFPRVYVRLNKKDGESEFIALDLQNGGNLIFTNSDQTVDIAVVPTLPNQEIFDFKAIPEEMIATNDSFAALHIGEGSDVFFAGLFISYYGEHRNNPIVRFGRVAMLPEDRIAWQDESKQTTRIRTPLPDRNTVLRWKQRISGIFSPRL